MQSDQLDEIREKWRFAQEYNNEIDKRLDLLEIYALMQSPPCVILLHSVTCIVLQLI